MMNAAELAQKIETAARHAFTELFEKYQDEEIYAFALYSDDGAETVCPAANTLAHLTRDSGEVICLYDKYETSEWKYEMQGAEADFNAVCRYLYDYKECYCNTGTFADYRMHLFEACFQVLKKLKEENFFCDIAGKDIFLMFTVSDSDFPETQRFKEMIKALNSAEMADEYLHYLENGD